MEASKLLEIFRKEAESNLNAIEQGLQIVAANDQDYNLLTFLYRHAHTLKGSASMMKFKRLAALATALEELFNRMRADALGVNPIFADILNDSIALLRTGVDDVVHEREETIDVKPLVDKIRAHLDLREHAVSEKNVQVCRLKHPFFRDEQNRLASWRFAVDRKQVNLPSGQSPYILIVEDSEMTLSLEKTMLSGHGYRVDTALDGLQALEMLKDRSYDLILSDIQMPRMNGYDLCQCVRKDPALRNIPFVFLTSLESEKDKERARQSGADALALKSNFNESELLALLFVMTVPRAA